MNELSLTKKYGINLFNDWKLYLPLLDLTLKTVMKKENTNEFIEKKPTKYQI